MHRTRLVCAALFVCALAACEERVETSAPAPAPRPAEPAPCPADIPMGGTCVRALYCVPPPSTFDGEAPSAEYPECPSFHRVPASEPSAVGERAYLMAGTTCARRREQGTRVCCYEYQSFCAR